MEISFGRQFVAAAAFGWISNKVWQKDEVVK